MKPGTTVIVTGDRIWDGSIWRGCRGIVTYGKPGVLPPGWSWVYLTRRPPNTPDRALGFRNETLKEIPS